MKDQVRTCIQCESEFVVTVSEQERLLSKGFDFLKRLCLRRAPAAVSTSCIFFNTDAVNSLTE